MNQLKNERGFGLIEVIIAATITSVIALAIADIITSQQNSVSLLEDKLEKIQLARNIEDILVDETACGNSFIGTQVGAIGTSRNVASIKDAASNVLISSNSVYGNLNVGQIELINRTVPGAASDGMVEVRVPISRVRNKSGLSDLRPISSTVSAGVDAGNNVAECGGSAGVGSIQSFTCNNMSGNGQRDCPIGLQTTFKTCFITGVYGGNTGDGVGTVSCKVIRDGVPPTGGYVIQAIGQDADRGIRCEVDCLTNN